MKKFLLVSKYLSTNEKGNTFCSLNEESRETVPV